MTTAKPIVAPHPRLVEPKRSKRAIEIRLTARRYLTFLVILLALWVARSFLIPLAWAVILAVTAWPLYARLTHDSKSRAWFAPLCVTLLVALILMVPLSVVAIEATRDSQAALGWLGVAERSGIPQPVWLQHLPFVGNSVSSWWNEHAANPQAASALIGRLNAGAVFSVTKSIGAQVAHGAMLFFITLLALFALLRNGTRLSERISQVTEAFFGKFGSRFIDRLVSAVRGTVAGTVFVALGEGVLIGVAYGIAGVPRPFLFAILTVAFAMLPFGAWAIFTVATVILVIQGSLLAAALLFAFATIVMLAGDNFVQPALIGNTIRLPFILALVGTFGGLETFGLVGLFLGPVIMAILLLIWDETLVETG